MAKTRSSRAMQSKKETKKVPIETKYASIDDLLKLCRPFKVVLLRCNCNSIHKPVKGKTICEIIHHFFIFLR